MGIFRSVLMSCWLCVCACAASLNIKVDQSGYLASQPKIAMVAAADRTHPATSFSVRRSADRAIVFTGSLSAPVDDEFSGDAVQTADFTAVQTNGEYYLDVPGVGRSWDFLVSDDVSNRTYFLAMRGFYAQRCGTAVDMGPEFPHHKHKICHTDGAYDRSSGQTGDHVSEKGWHDAGDYGRYVVNSGISTGTLLWAYDLYGERAGKIGLQIPESGNDTPDILNEIRWNVDWMLTMQDSDGGVWHKQTSTHFCRFIPPEDDKLPSVVIGTGFAPYKSSCATADFAAVTALSARLFLKFDRAYAAKCRAAAEAAWRWLEKNPSVLYTKNPAGISTGAYSDNDCSDEELWAAVELWRTTGDAAYEQYFLAHYTPMLKYLRAVEPQSWSQVAPLALWAYVLGHGHDARAVETIRTQAVAAADEIVSRTQANPYRNSLTRRDYIWGSNGVAMNYSMQLLVADRMQPNPSYFEAALDNLHYVLGRNTFSLSWLTAAGQHSVQHPHHRPSGSHPEESPWPGLMSGGPNPGRQDATARRLIPAGTPPARCYVDETEAYSCNEIAINWNAPLVFTLAAAVR